MFGLCACIAFLFLVAEISTSPTPTIEKRSERTSAPSGCLTVGTGGTYTTFGDALAVLGSSTDAACIYLASGTYEEQNTIDYPGSLTIYGETTYVESYKDNTVTITYSQTSDEAADLQASATIQVVSSGVSFYNINVVNGYGAGTQAVALTLNGDELALYACQVIGYQDTLYVLAGTQYIANSLIQGNVDFIFGGASVWITNCDIEFNGAGGSITASARDTDDDTWFVIDTSNIEAASGYLTTEDNYLGRPWGALARVQYQYCMITDVINPAGWSTLAADATPLFYEYENTGDGSSTTDRLYETVSPGSVDITTVLGTDYADWVITDF